MNIEILFIYLFIYFKIFIYEVYTGVRTFMKIT